MGILKTIVKNKLIEIEDDKKKYTINTLERLININNQKKFKNLLSSKQKNKKNNIVGEIKKASPSAGIIIENYDPISIAKNYEKNNIGAISILTDKKFFMGNLEHISIIKKNIELPILRKDFIIDPYQVAQSKFFGADAILLIMSILSKNQAKEIIDICQKYKIDCIIEIHKINEINDALDLKYPIIGINNRNLDTLDTNLKNTIELVKEIPENYTIIAESGIKTKEDIKFYNKIGIYNFLIGEALLKNKITKEDLKKIL